MSVGVWGRNAYCVVMVAESRVEEKGAGVARQKYLHRTAASP